MCESDLLREEVDELGEERFPDTLNIQHLELPLDYEYEPGSQQDGVTLNVPLEALNQVAPEPLGWLVPGRVEEKVLALIRSLPKTLRTQFVPAPETAKRVVPMLQFGVGDIRVAVAAILSRLGGIEVPPTAFQEDRLPEELRMNVRVTDAEGKLLASGRDLENIRSELGQQATEIFLQMDDPRWTRDGLTSWDFDSLPAEIDLQRERLAVKAYPSLVDCGDTVSLRLVDSPARAEYETHFGLRRLYFLAAQRELKSQVAWLPNLKKMEVCAASLPGFDLRKQLTELLTDRAMVADQPVPRTKEEFERLLAEGRKRIAWAVQELPALAGPIFETCHEANLALEKFCDTAGKTNTPATLMGVALRKNAPGGLFSHVSLPQKTSSKTLPKAPLKTSSKTSTAAFAAPGRRQDSAKPPRWQYAIDDIRQQITRLMDTESFSKTPWECLRQYPRYFRAICSRLENLTGGVPRDLQNFEEFQTQWKRYEERAEQHRALGIVDPELIHFRWMLEEYRVSLFAQKLGTAIPVSPKRLDQQWGKLSQLS
jgi:hypothetical protein